MTDTDAYPVDPPIPVPDVPGGDADARGLPRRVDLTLRQRLVVDASAVADLALRTGIASLVATTMVPSLFGSLGDRRSGAEREHLEFYAELAGARDPARSFPTPTEAPRVTTRTANPVAELVARGRVENLRFNSSFVAVNPALREQCRGFTRNNVVHAQHWRHDDGPRPTLCFIHGFMGSPYLLNGVFFSLPWFFRSGYDVLLYTLPFHGPRAEKGSPFSGHGFFAHGFSGFAEAMAQAVHDFRSVIDYLEFTGVDRIALTGMSLGGYTAALIASVDHRIQAVIPNVPVVAPDQTVDEWFPANKVVGLRNLLAGTDSELTKAATRYSSPLNYRPLVPKKRRLIIAGLGDKLAPPQQAEMLWRHWDRCAFHWFPGNHVLHVSQPDYLRRMTRFMNEFMFD
ncbi:prolyl oligopeptidase family protein [Mycolicibacterium phlei]|uniref:Peptidase n=1 Tax=Mycolicibacterium phlei DSM 43239 = CCUG 21000 TaxID=1226750 RepID=A0A5N5VCD6_MYCPH|nr:alpha/beta fold hydrolase [Mycolicibacterium phlei]VEG11632.1 prolyl oligopeptidase family protein [Mycobacteroides chelonae]AMO63538.1 Alpha/beta hydrolase family protein [Mycolicibacterium phlei]EID16241.1 prolyl oligopeptidase family protein [Mycolicibacterium phlei RIVM601174]KAB7759622.1 peptidase [Mycolicibacterium phlei DSM 43239 = CCUG 21000]KXW68665.1 peptidase [Mycolicibacterium phlei DSM 43239 = CCUG 21000]